jgi:hypothetical protein
MRVCLDAPIVGAVISLPLLSARCVVAGEQGGNASGSATRAFAPKTPIGKRMKFRIMPPA